MKFYLINPKLPLSFTGNEYAAPVVFKKYSVPPLGLLTVAGMIPRHHEVAFCDENVADIDFDMDCDVVGITGMHLQGPGLRKIAQRFRARGKTVVVGGPSSMAVPERYRDVADVLMLGECEQIWPKCIEDLENGVAKASYTPADTVDVRTSPVPRYDLVSRRDYMQISLQTTRGCPFKCEFCDIITLYGRKVRTKSVDQVLAEVKTVLSLGWDRLFFVDDNFIGDPKYTMSLMEALSDLQKTRKKPFVFSTQATINVAHNQHLLKLLHEGGCRSMFIGIETPRVSSLQETQKFQNVRKDTLGEVARIQSQGMAVYSGLIVGFDHDDEDIFQEQVDFINDAKIPLPFPSLLGALPATPLYKRMVDEGRVIAENEFQGNTFFTNIRPTCMSMEALQNGFLRMVQALYDPKNFSDRCLGEIERLNGASGRASNYKRPLILGGFAWVLLWYLFDPNRKRLLQTFVRLFPAFWRFPNAADAALQRLVTYRHVIRYVSMLEARHASKPDVRSTGASTVERQPESVPA